MQTTFTTPKKSQEELRAMFEKMSPASNTVPVEYVEDGEKKTTVLNMANGLDGFQKTLTFWSGQVLPEIPQIFIPDSESNSTPRSKLKDTVDVGSRIGDISGGGLSVSW